MLAFHLLVSFCGLAFVAVPTAADALGYPSAGVELTVATWRGEWLDASRGRSIPVKIYYPEANPGRPSPVIIFSHGLGGSRETYGYLGQYWAAHGYISVHLQHAGSDTAILFSGTRPAEALKAAVSNPDNFVNRPQDVRFAIDELTRLSADPSFPPHGRMALDRIGIAGHSFGAYTVMATAGQAIGRDRALHYYGPDRRILAGIAMSSSAAQLSDLDRAYDRITIPIFHMTGTKDQVGDGYNGLADTIIGNQTPAQRRVAYDHTRHAPAYLITFQDGDHRVFSGRRRQRSGDGEHDAAYQKIICVASTAFWDANLKKDLAAQRWLDEGDFGKFLGHSGTFERKRP